LAQKTGNSSKDRHIARAAEFARAERARAGSMKAANLETTGLDPEMAKTLGQEAARRVGAGGVSVQTRNPFAGLFRRRKVAKP
jgi:hypothetical protein